MRLHRFIFVGMCVLFFQNCKARQTGTKLASNADQLSQSAESAVLPIPPKDESLYQPNEVQIDYIVDAMIRAKLAFYTDPSFPGAKPAYAATPKGMAVPPFMDGAGLFVHRFSLLADFYWNLFPTYSPGFRPNMKMCFNSFATDSQVFGHIKVMGKYLSLEESYKYCVFMPKQVEDANIGRELSYKQYPAYDTEWEKSSPRGPLSWVYKDQDDVFRFLMLSGPCGIDPLFQEKIFARFMEKVKDMNDPDVSKIPLNIYNWGKGTRQVACKAS